MTTYHYFPFTAAISGGDGTDWNDIRQNGVASFTGNWTLLSSTQPLIPGPTDVAVLDDAAVPTVFIHGGDPITLQTDAIDTLIMTSQSLSIDSPNLSGGLFIGQGAFNSGTPLSIASGLAININGGHFAAPVELDVGGGTIVNSGTINVHAIGQLASAAIFSISGNTHLSGGGSIALVVNPLDIGINFITGVSGAVLAPILDNFDNTISGAGFIGDQGGRTLAFRNESGGTVNANNSASRLTMQMQNAVFNGGFIEATAAAELDINATTISQTSSGTIAALGSGTSVRLFSGSTIVGGTLNSTSGGVLQTVDPGGGAGASATLDGSTSGGAVTNRGTVFVADNTVLDLKGTITNSGSIVMSAGPNHTAALNVLSGGVILNGGGSVSLIGNTGADIVTGSSTVTTLHNVDNTISGGGFIGDTGGNFLALDNQSGGTVNASNSTMALRMQNAVSNAGILEATSGGTLNIHATTVNQTATGVVEALGGSQVNLLSGTIIAGGTLNSTSGGVVHTIDPGGGTSATLDGSTGAGAVTNLGNVAVGDVTTLFLLGSIINSGTMTVAAGGHFAVLDIGSGGATLTGGGSVVLGTGGPSFIRGATTATTLHNVNNTISGGGAIDDTGGNLDNQSGGTVNATEAGTPITIFATSAVTNNGLMESTATGGLFLSATVNQGATGKIEAVGSGAYVEVNAGGINNSGGLIEALTSGTVNIGAAVTNSAGGVIESLGAASHVNVNAALTNNGSFIADAGIVNINAAITGTGSAIIRNGGRLNVNASFQEGVQFQGIGGGTLALPFAQTPYNGTVTGFTPGDTFDLTTDSFTTAGTVLLKAGNVLEVKENGHTYDFNLDPIQNFAGWDFKLSTDGASGTNVRLGAQVDDFNRDRTSDILFRNDTSGDTWVEGISNGAFANWNQIGGSNTSYAAAGVGDFYGTGTSDFLFRNNASGDTWLEAISNYGFASWQQIGGSDTRYSVVGVADFYGNGTEDILFRNSSSGDTWFEAISNGTFAGWHQVGGSDTNYAAVGIGDFYGAGTDDILFRNSSTGDTWFAQMSNGAFASWQHVGGSDTRYAVVGVGDFIGNGIDDILFRNNSTGDTWFEAISNGAFSAWRQVGGSDTNYAAVGVGDYLGNGTQDILFRNNGTGDTWIEALSNGNFNSWNHVGGSNASYTVKT
jgi:hypothetical protein